MNKRICDKCNKEVEKEICEGVLFECFEGNLEGHNFDLCGNCWVKLQKIIEEFTKLENDNRNRFP